MLWLQRRYNNNVVQATDDAGRSLVILGRGVGFGVSKGEQLDPARVEMTYVLETQQRAASIADALSALPADILTLARHVVTAAEDRLGMANPQALLLPIADHLHAAVKRSRTGEQIDFPLEADIAQLYPQELDFGRHVCRMTMAELGVTLPPVEAAAFALHAVSTQFTSSRIPLAVAMTTMIDEILSIVSRESGIELSKNERATARFITHIRYLFSRIDKASTYEEGQSEVVAAIRDSLARSWAIAEIIGGYLEGELKRGLSKNETAYLALHIGRLTTRSQ
ncbi:Transcription antiterminator LicT [Corynebacterium atrinae]|uniref:PRD domain-containing protein n=1 Tax=Corynebacterium atrinae TaxID=1336740 RepID=UPI0025B54C53|nr:PRD domain-containing protein [Corynebacterium atrinae]WJY63160.1 Transcription antiterminator LicT [Corynebacterium atrinae]